MRNIYIVLVFMFFASQKMIAQDTLVKKIPNIAIFTPLYLDSTFTTVGSYKYGKLIPSYAISGVEYLYGATIAIDSLIKENQGINFFIFDSKSATKTINSLIANGDLNNMDLIMGAVMGMDVKLLADFAAKKNIPFISATFPNDVGINNNPNFLLLNSTLKTNCEAIHSLVQTKFKDQRIVVLSKEGKQEDRIVSYYKAFEKNSNGSSLGITYINVGANATTESIAQCLDSTVLTSIIIASADVAFAKQVAQTVIAYNQQEQVNLLGLPTWDDASEFLKKEYKDIHFYYSTAMLKPSNTIANKLANGYKYKYGTSGGDNLYRGYENTYKFTKLLLKFGKNITSNFADKAYTTLYSYNIQPVMLSSVNMTLDYFENKKVAVMKRYNGLTSQIMQ